MKTKTMSPETLRETRESLGLTRKSFAALVGVVDKSTVYRWETRRSPIPHWLPMRVGLLLASRSGGREA